MFWYVKFTWGGLHPSLLVGLMVASYFYLFVSFSGGSSLWALSGTWFGVDEMSFFLLILSKMIFLWIILAGSSETRVYLTVVYSMGYLVGGCFYLHSVIIFYSFFEASLIPMMILILGWGYQPERLEASKYLLAYTVFFSFPLLLCILSLEWGGEGVGFWVGFWWSVEWGMRISGGGYVISSFYSKNAVVWYSFVMPKAHVEASSGGSMILAAVLLKLGGIGVWRVAPALSGLNSSVLVLGGVGLWGGAVISVVCLVQSDLKLLVAYSSVAHMSLVIWGLLGNTVLSSHGGMLMMVAHGFASSGLFYVAGILFKEVGSRSLILNQGLLVGVPGLALWWFLLQCLSMATPPSMNFFSEIEILIFSYSFGVLGWLAILVMGFFSVAYSMLCYTMTSHGRPSSTSRSTSGYGVERQVMLFHVVGSMGLLFTASGV
uniref:NADH-ubiquinone oxidoreductase chain 4 n=1 Tax=Tigriopus japonicus TaxID=158387 RepID=Q1EDK0_TIGJA|nr:NADH dehydrogenase subunit 4 [Tigriopus japonicus]